MSKKLAALALAALVACSHAVYAQDAAPSKEALEAAKVKAKIGKRGEGERVEVKLRDGKRVKGRITLIDEDHFTIIDPKTDAETAVQYAQVESVRNRLISKRMKVASFVIVGAMTPLLIAVAAVAVTGGQ